MAGGRFAPICGQPKAGSNQGERDIKKVQLDFNCIGGRRRGSVMNYLKNSAILVNGIDNSCGWTCNYHAAVGMTPKSAPRIFRG